MTTGQLWLGIVEIMAIIVGPILAVQIQKYLEKGRAAKGRKLDVFRRIMVTRAAPLNVNHIEALNLIEAEYDPKKKSDKAVLDRWHELWDHLNKRHGGTPSEQTLWDQGRADALGNLLFEMSEHLRLGIERSVLKRPSYYPTYYGNLDADNAVLRQACIEALTGVKPMKVQIIGTETPVHQAPQHQEIENPA